MAISIECEECHRQYKLDDRLAGKTVKCKGCGGLIRVPAVEAAGVEESRDCLACGTPMAPGNRVCVKCGFNIQTGQKESILLTELAEEQLKEQKKRRWIRKQGSPLLEWLDEGIKLLLTLVLLGGIIMTIVHIARSPNGTFYADFLPTIVVVVALAAIVSPLAALAVNVTVKAMKLATRDDTYVRVLMCMLLPFSVSMLVGWPETVKWHWLAILSWPLAIGALVYFFRADKMEWIASVGAALGAMALSLIVVSLLGGAVDNIAGGMYGDMLPSGPWTGLASGKSPEPDAATQKAPATAPVVNVTPAPVAPTVVTPVAPVVVATQETTPVTPVVADTEPTPTPTPAVVVVPTPTPGRPGRNIPPAQPALPTMNSPFFASVVDEPVLRDAVAVVVPVAPSEWMLTVRDTDTTTEVDRWNLNPLTKKENLSFPLVARKGPQFAISTRGDAVAVLSSFPNRQLDMIAFDPKIPFNLATARKRVAALDQQNNIPDGQVQAVPTMLGVLDLTHYYLRWDLNGMSALQIFAGAATGNGTPPWRGAPFGPAVDTAPAAFAPNGHTAAIFGRNTITFANVDQNSPPRPIAIASDLRVRVIGMVFSPDSAQLAVYAAVSDLPTVMGYTIKTGAPSFTSLLSQTPVAANGPFMPHAILWLPGAKACLINGNDLVDPVSGKKFATLGLTGVMDAQLVGPSMLAVTFKTGDKPRTILAKLADDQIQAAKGN